MAIDAVVITSLIVLPNQLFHCNQVNDSTEITSLSYRQLKTWIILYKYHYYNCIVFFSRYWS